MTLSKEELLKRKRNRASEKRRSEGIPTRIEYLARKRLTDKEKKAHKAEYEKKRYEKNKEEMRKQHREYYYKTHPTRRPPKISDEELKERRKERSRIYRLEKGMTPRKEIVLLTDEEKKLRKKKQMKEYYQNNKEKIKKYQKNHRDQMTPEQEERRKEKNRKRQIERMKDPKIKKENNERNSKIYKQNTEKCIKYFGGKCQCECGCTEDNSKLLTFGHPNNDGFEDRKKTKSTKSLVGKLVKNNFKHEFEINLECYNCNMSKFRNNGVCAYSLN